MSEGESKVAAELRSSWQDIIHPDAYAEHGYPHDVWTWLLAACVVCLLGELGALLVFRT